MDGHNFERLKAHILNLSVATEFEQALLEWKLDAVEVSEDMDQCPCGKDIKEHCYIRNIQNGKKTYVGNVCINRFMRIDTGSLFQGLRRIALDPTANANLDVVEYAWKKGFLFGEEEYSFLKRTVRKRNLSSSQISWKKKVNARILKGTVVRRRTVRD